MNQTFMGHGIDGVIIQPPMEWDEDLEVFAAANRSLALENLNREAKICAEMLKND